MTNYEDQDLWPFKCSDCGHEFHEEIGTIRANGYKVRCPGPAHRLGGYSMTTHKHALDSAIELARQGQLDPYADMFQLARPFDMHDLFLIGTHHDLQTHSDAFEKALESYLDAITVKTIAEEMSLAGLARRNATASVGNHVATKRGLESLYCDLDREERARLGLPAREWIAFNGQQQGHSEKEIQRQVRKLLEDPREHYWLKKLQEHDRWPVLFICGADHVDWFAAKVRAIGRSVRILARDWAPANQLSPGVSGVSLINAPRV